MPGGFEAGAPITAFVQSFLQGRQLQRTQERVDFEKRRLKIVEDTLKLKQEEAEREQGLRMALPDILEKVLLGAMGGGGDMGNFDFSLANGQPQIDTSPLAAGPQPALAPGEGFQMQSVSPELRAKVDALKEAARLGGVKGLSSVVKSTAGIQTLFGNGPKSLKRRQAILDNIIKTGVPGVSDEIANVVERMGGLKNVSESALNAIHGKAEVLKRIAGDREKLEREARRVGVKTEEGGKKLKDNDIKAAITRKTALKEKSVRRAVVNQAMRNAMTLLEKRTIATGKLGDPDRFNEEYRQAVVDNLSALGFPEFAKSLPRVLIRNPPPLKEDATPEETSNWFVERAKDAMGMVKKFIEAPLDTVFGPVEAKPAAQRTAPAAPAPVAPKATPAPTRGPAPAAPTSLSPEVERFQTNTLKFISETNNPTSLRKIISELENPRGRVAKIPAQVREFILSFARDRLAGGS